MKNEPDVRRRRHETRRWVIMWSKISLSNSKEEQVLSHLFSEKRMKVKVKVLQSCLSLF